MSLKIVFRPEAQSDLEDSFNWYENQRRGLGSEFFLCVEVCLEKIGRNPKLFSVVYKDLRRALIRRFPYQVLYQEKEDKIIIFAIFHVKRNSKIWEKRLS